MKCFRRFFCVLLACVLSLGVFSVTASAEEVPIDGYQIKSWYKVQMANVILNGSQITTFYPGDGSVISYQPRTNYGTQFYLTTPSPPYTFTINYQISYANGAALATRSKDAVTLAFKNFYYSLLWYDGTSLVYYRKPTDIQALVTYSDGNSEYFPITEYYNDGANLTAYLEFTPDLDVTMIELIVEQDFSPGFDKSNGYYVVYVGEIGGDDSFHLTIDKPTKSEGLLAGILDKAKETVDKLKDGFKDTVDNLKNGFKNVVDTLTSLPVKLWEKIADGLKDLFIPDEEYLLEYKDRMDEFLAEKFGAIYQVVQVTFESWDRVQASDEQNTIEFPETTIEITNDTSFTFGGYDVPIVPSGFEWLATAAKAVCGIVCTILFVNGLRKRYDEVMGVEK